MMSTTTTINNPYIPFDAVITDITELNNESKSFKLKLSQEFSYEPGQFVKVTVYGVGESAIGITNTMWDDRFELAVRNTGGLVTSALHQKKVGDVIGIRGPFGKPFPLKSFKGKNILFIGAGIGLWPIRSCVKDIIHNRKDYGKLELLVGVKEPKLFTFNNDVKEWIDREDMTVKMTVDGCHEEDHWSGNVGLITKLTDALEIENPADWQILCCGPPVAIKFIARSLNNKGFSDHQIWLSLERRMQCGIGKCNHCLINGNVYVCRDGPVFTMAEIKNLPGALD
jgi:NAD(P)H-flavin reductase